MIVDASALLAIVLEEPDGRHFANTVTSADRARMTAPGWFEAAMIVERRGDPVARDRFDATVAELRIEIEPFTAAHAVLARQAWRDYGRGSGHPARLNFGDCLAYGFAKVEGQPLLFKGNDFAQTDIEPALKA